VPRLITTTTTTMEVSFALTGKDFVLIAADQNAGRSIIKMKSDEDKIKALGSHLLMSYSGEPGEALSFAPKYYIVLTHGAIQVIRFNLRNTWSVICDCNR
jgi:20S proteasome alpha/beta subunit